MAVVGVLIGLGNLYNIASAAPLDSGISVGEVEDQSYLSYATTVMDNLITYGTDRYGAVQSNDHLVSSLDVTTKDNPPTLPNPALGEFSDSLWRAGRHGRRSPGGSNFFHNQSVFSAMNRASQATDDNTYSNFVDANMVYSLSNHVEASTGLLWWGWHRHVDVHTDTLTGHAGNRHEMHYSIQPQWEEMWAANSSATQTEIEEVWQRHIVDKTTGRSNRHHSGGTSWFTSSQAEFVDAFAFMHTKQPGLIPGESNPDIDTWLERTKVAEGWIWSERNPTTNLFANDEGFSYSLGVSVGLMANGLLSAYAQTGDMQFRDHALAYLDGWGTYALDATSGSFYGQLALDGTPQTGTVTPDTSFYNDIDLWQPAEISGYQDLAQAYADAYQTFGDTGLLKTTAERWAAVYRANLPAGETKQNTWYDGYSDDWSPFGTYAEHYGKAIDFFLTMYDVTSEDHYLLSARDIAKEAVSKLWYDGLFRGHQAKQYYEAIDGVGFLLEALVDLDAQSANFAKFGDFDNDGNVTVADFENYMVPNMLTNVSPYADGDVTGDGFVGPEDFERFKLEYFEGPPSALSFGVPEPGSFVLALLALCSVCRWRFRRN